MFELLQNLAYIPEFLIKIVFFYIDLDNKLVQTINHFVKKKLSIKYSVCGEYPMFIQSDISEFYRRLEKNFITNTQWNSDYPSGSGQKTNE